jgi:type I restriction enzyme M protein
MHRVAPSEKDTATDTLEKRVWAAAGQAVPAPHSTAQYAGGRPPRPRLGLIFLRIVNLRRTRDLLLPRLLSGQVELKTEAA